MIHFRDMSFCSSDCTNSGCHRHFGEDDQKAATEWARRCGFDHEEAPVAFSDFSPDCKEYRKPEAK